MLQFYLKFPVQTHQEFPSQPVKVEGLFPQNKGGSILQDKYFECTLC